MKGAMQGAMKGAILQQGAMKGAMKGSEKSSDGGLEPDSSVVPNSWLNEEVRSAWRHHYIDTPYSSFG